MNKFLKYLSYVSVVLLFIIVFYILFIGVRQLSYKIKYETLVKKTVAEEVAPLIKRIEELEKQ